VLYVPQHKTCPEAHPVYYPLGIGGGGAVSLGVEQQEHEAVHSSPSIAKVQNGGAIPPLPHIPAWHNAQLINHKDNFTLYVLCMDDVFPGPGTSLSSFTSGEMI
jgi:hypothetical protein